MTGPGSGRETLLFTLRMWREGSGMGKAQWRGRLFDVTHQEVHYFQGCRKLIRLLQFILANEDHIEPGRFNEDQE